MENNCETTDFEIEHAVEIKQVLGLRYNSQLKTVEIGVKCGDKSIEMALKVEEAKEFQAGLAMVLEEAALDMPESAPLPESAE